ncbi:OmpA family protein [uncultured Phenylobacterium sp.]|uniref:OmpA family protein n=1 Tax=uncultured Phenylobacterium sp. TaxID=349273 RepID=UPI0025D491D2|nr:OmpA family protein [uncultured Phenylobacterium sp.]
MKTATMTGLVLTVGLAGCSSTGMRARMERPAPVCEDVTVPVYFDTNRAQLTREGRRVIAMAAADARGCTVDKVQVTGLADASGDPAANLELSRARAASVADALLRAKLPPAEFDLTAVGQAGAVNTEGQNRPLRRRTDLVLKLSKPKT